MYKVFSFLSFQLIGGLLPILFLYGAGCTTEFGSKKPVCGNGVLEAEESCDGTDFGGFTCADVTNFVDGFIVCTEDCKLDLSQCYTCGNGMIEGPESCDGENFGFATCMDYGFYGGTLACLSDCTGFDTTDCEGFCGDGGINGQEGCDDGNTDPGDGCTEECVIEPGWECEGEPSECIPICGNGVIAGDQECDDGNTESGDGCSDECKIEPFFYCEGEPSVCICRVFVDGRAEPEDQDGAYWTTAFAKVRYGIQKAEELISFTQAEFCEVWVAGGVYHIYETSPDDTVNLASNVGVYGGFDGSELLKEDRDLHTNETVLDGSSETSSELKVEHVVMAADTENAVLDGFAIINGMTNNWGGGLRSVDSKLHVENCVFAHNEAGEGGGANFWQSIVTLYNCTFSENLAQLRGGGLRANDSEITLSSCSLANNTTGEDETSRGGGFYSEGHLGKIEIVDSTFGPGNHSIRGGGVNVAAGSLLIMDSLFEGNSAVFSGGAVRSRGNTTIENSVFTNNTSEYGGALTIPENGVAVIYNSTFDSNCGNSGGGGILVDKNTSVTLENSILVENTSDEGGGVRAGTESEVVIQNSIFWKNNADSIGGGVYGSIMSMVSVINSLFYQNEAGEIGGISMMNAPLTVVNSILRANVPQQIGSTASLEVRYSNVQNGPSGSGNIDDEPLFIDPENGDFRLQSQSPCIDAGDGDWASEFDMDGNPRVEDPNTSNTGTGDPGYTDIGPYEYQP